MITQESPQAAHYGLPAEGKKRWCSGCAKGHAGAVDISHKKCEDCKVKYRTFGLPAEGKNRWCSGCAKGHAGAVDVSHKKCEDCHLKVPTFGLPADGVARWCSGCAKGQAGVVDISHRKMCEGCQLKVPSFGLPAEGKARWCGGCAKGHAGAVNVVSKKCEGCGLTQPHFGLPAEGKKRWCSGCAKGHTGAVDGGNRKCEGCLVKRASFWLPADGKKRRWCSGCAPQAATSEWRLKRAGGSPQKKRNATGPPLPFQNSEPLFGVQISKYRLAIGNPYEAAPRAGLRVWRARADYGDGCPDEEMWRVLVPPLWAWRRLRARGRVAQLMQCTVVTDERPGPSPPGPPLHRPAILRFRGGSLRRVNKTMHHGSRVQR
jgi:hypothetical protein